MRPSCLFGVMSSVGGVPVRGVSMVGRLLVVPGVVMFASFCVVLSSICGVFCCLLVVFRSFLGHGVSPQLVVGRWQAFLSRETTKRAYQQTVPLRW
jgi:hypothetical protein